VLGEQPQFDCSSTRPPPAPALVQVERFFTEVAYSLHTRPNDIDSLGHVNNAVVLEYFEAARWDWVTQMGIEHRSRIAVVVSRIVVDYVGQIFPGKLLVNTRFLRSSDDWLDEISYKAVVEQTVRAEGDSRELAKAKITLAFIGATTGALCTLQEYLQL